MFISNYIYNVAILLLSFFWLQDNIVVGYTVIIFFLRPISYLIHSYNLFFASGQYHTWYTVTIYFLLQANTVPDTQFTIYFLLQANIVPDTQLQFIFCFRTISYLIQLQFIFCFRPISYLIHSLQFIFCFRPISYLIHSYNLFFASGQYHTSYTITIYFLLQDNIVPDTRDNLFLFFRTIQSYLIHHYFLQRYLKKMKICGRMYK